MARVSLDVLRQRALQVNQAPLDATTDADIEEQADDEDSPPTAGALCPVLSPREVRLSLGMSQAEFAEALLVPVGTIRNWEQGRSLPDPAARPRGPIAVECRSPCAGRGPDGLGS